MDNYQGITKRAEKKEKTEAVIAALNLSINFIFWILLKLISVKVFLNKLLKYIIRHVAEIKNDKGHINSGLNPDNAKINKAIAGKVL